MLRTASNFAGSEERRVCARAVPGAGWWRRKGCRRRPRAYLNAGTSAPPLRRSSVAPRNA